METNEGTILANAPDEQHYLALLTIEGLGHKNSS